ncbi:MFS transporter [Niveispirillum sp.]|uniref:MFS transporter n=1 Tax=Niveispirillum sp. TaxID=1917217 RepID=UPI001B681499|nr:MFS transporter [Niveispirillum sp.]MBP7336554.1 MFS transporter [Niveispirillum sp.]
MQHAATEQPGQTLEGAIIRSIDGARGWRSRWRPPVLLGVTLLFDFWDIAILSFIMPLLSAEWQLTPVAIGTLVSAGYAGQLIGALAMGPVAERFGRLRVVVWCVSFIALFAAGCAVAPGYHAFMALRFCQGLLLGGVTPVAIAYINELAPTSSRARFFSIFEMFMLSGWMWASMLSWMIVPHLGWRVVVAIGVFPLLLVSVVVALLPESPLWLARRRGIGAVNAALGRIDVPPVEDRAYAVPDGAEQKGSILDLFRGDLRRRTILGMFLWLMTSFVSWSLSTWMPTLYVSRFNFPLQLSLQVAGIASVLYVVTLPLVGVLLDRFGRRRVAITGTSLSTLVFLAIAASPELPRPLLVALIVSGQMGISAAITTLWPYTAEIYPTRVRAVAMSFSSSFARAGSMINPIVIGFILSAGGSANLIFLLLGVLAIGVTCLWVFFTRETAGRRMDG